MGLDMYLHRFTMTPDNVTVLPDGSVDIPPPPRKMTYTDHPWVGSGEINDDGESEGPYDHATEVAYWRKANQIHNWFIQNCAGGKDECEWFLVTVDQLRELLALCHKVKETATLESGQIVNGYRINAYGREPIMEDGERITNAEAIAKLLPTTAGFFFGSTDYDGYYMSDIDETIRQLTKILDGDEEDETAGIQEFDQFYYHPSW